MLENEMNLSNGHSNLPHSARESSLLFPGIKQTPITTSLLNSGLSNPAMADTGNSFLSILSGPPSLLQYDFDHQSNLKSPSNSISRSFPDQSAQFNASRVGSHPLLNVSDKLIPRDTVGAHSVYSFGPPIGASYGNDCGVNNLWALINSSGFGNEKASNNSLQKGVTRTPSDSPYGEVLHGLTNNVMSRASSLPPSSMSRKQPSGVNGCPRVFCMGLCGELLISNTGIFGILCSCHGSHMPVNKFCEHSGLYDVNPGYAVRMESGEFLAQWRKKYLEEFGIRAPEDHRGWDWPEELLATCHFANSSVAVADRRKVFDMSGLFTSSAESAKSMQPGNHVFASSAQLSKEYANPVSIDSHRKNDCSPFSFPVSSCRNTVNSPHTMPEYTMRVCASPSCLTASEETWKEKLPDGSHSRSNFSMFSTSGNMSGSAFLKSRSISSEACRSLKEEIVSFRDTLSSSIELKLGQPSPLGWGPVPTSLSASIFHSSDDQATTIQEKTRNLGNSKFTEISNQCSHNHSASNLSRTKKQYHKGLVDNTPCGAQGASHVENLKDGFANSSALSVLTPTSAEGFVYQKETTERTTEAHHCTPSALHYQPNVYRASLIDFSCSQNNPVGPLDTSKLALQSGKNRFVGTRYGHNVPHDGSVSSFKLYAREMESYGLFTKDSKASHPRIPTEKFSSFGKDSSAPGTSGASSFAGNILMGRCSDPDLFAQGLKNSTMGFKANQNLQAISTGCSLSAAALLPCDETVSLDEDVGWHISGERLRVPVLGNVKQSAKGCSVDAPCESNQLLNDHATDQRQESKANSVSTLSLHGSFQDKGLLKGQRHVHQSAAGHDAALTFHSGIGHAKDARCWDDSGVFQRGFVNKNQGDSDTHLHQRYIYTTQPTCTNNVYDPEATGPLYGFQQQVSFATVESFKGAVKKPTGDYLSECQEKDKTRAHQKLVCFGSQWRDVPSKTNTVSKMRCVDATLQLLETRKSDAHLKDPSAEYLIESNQVAESSKGKALSKMSLGYSVPAVTQASNEVDKIDSCIVDDGDIGYNDQIVDQESATVRSCSSVNAIDAVKSYQPFSCGEPTSIETVSIETVSQNVPCDDLNDEFTHIDLKSNQLQNTSFPGATSDKFSNEGQEDLNGTQSRKRKHTTRWKMVGATISVSEVFPSHIDSQLHSGKNIAHHTHACEHAQVSYGDSDGRSLKKRRSTLCQVKMFSRKRGPNGAYKFLDSEFDDQRLLKGRDEFVGIPGKTVVKRLKCAEFHEAVKNQVKSTEGPMEFGLSNLCSNGISGLSLKGCIKARPVACGKYGIICDQGLDIKQLKSPKIVPLSQVLKASKRCTEFKKELAAPLPGKMVDGHFSASKGWFDGCSNFQTASGTQDDEALSCSNEDNVASVHEIQTIQRDVQPADDGSMPEVGNNTHKSNRSVSFCRVATRIKAKGIRLRSLYELSMRGNKFISADLNLLQNVMCASSTERELERRKESEDDGESDRSECEADGRRLCKKARSVPLTSDKHALCCVCGISNKDNANCLLECACCSIRIHQACYGISRMPKGEWLCRPCRTRSKDVVCVLCGYGGGAMTRAFGSRQMVQSLLKAWNIRTESHIMIIGSAEPFCAKVKHGSNLARSDTQSYSLIKPVVHNSIVAGLFNPNVKQWAHMVCGLWTPGTRCPNVNTMSAFDVSGVYYQNLHVVCDICKRPGGSCIRCRIETCCAYFHPSCAHQKGLLQTEVEGVDGDKVGFYGRCLLHATLQSCALKSDDIDQVKSDTRHDEEPTCARTEAYEGQRHESRWKRSPFKRNRNSGCLVSQVQLDAWNHINKHKLRMRRQPRALALDVEHDYRKEYARFKQAKGWRQLVVYKSGIHALGLYTSQFIPRGAMVVEYIGEVVGLRVADKRETEYLSGRRLQYKSACYFFRIDKEQIIDATCKGGIARFVNHSCQPNCIAKVITVRSEKKVVFLSQRDIYPGEEITYDYHFNHEDEGKKIPCFCNAENCRRYLN